MTLKGLVFDFDGLILDTELPEYQAWQDIYHRYNRELPLEEWAKILGTSPEYFDAAKYLEQQTGLSLDCRALHNEQRAIADAIIRESTPLPGIVSMLTRATELKLRLAVASSSPADWVLGHLTRLGLLRYFDHVFTARDVKQVKPDPELYLTAIRALGIQSYEAMAFEDSPNGITAALAAGLFCVAVPNTLTSKLNTDHASIRYASLGTVTLDQVIEQFNLRTNHKDQH